MNVVVCVHINKRLWVRAQLGKGKAFRVNQRRATNNNSARAKMRRVFLEVSGIYNQA